MAALSKLNPKKLFLFDAAGALISMISLGLVLPYFQSYIGIPKSTLYFLASIPILFVIFDIYAAFQSKFSSKLLLKCIAIANLIYIFISSFMLFKHFTQITPLGIAYFILEIIIILFIVRLELQSAKAL